MARLFMGSLSLAAAAPVTILPLGDSITFGCGDNFACGDQCTAFEVLGFAGVPKTQTGWRGPLWHKLSPGSVTSPDWDFVGTHQNGPDDTDRDHEGYPGYTIENIYDNRDGWIALKPDVILLHLGTNNMGRGLQQADVALEKMQILLDGIFEGLPNVRLLLSTLIGSNIAYGGKQHLPFNEGIREFVSKYAGEGRNIELVDMARESAIGEDGCAAEYCCTVSFPTGIHPSSKGYPLMADVWYNHIVGNSAVAEVAEEAEVTLPWLTVPSDKCSNKGDCGNAYQACCLGFQADGFPCGCHLADGGSGLSKGDCGDCGAAYTLCCAGFAADGYACTCDVSDGGVVV